MATCHCFSRPPSHPAWSSCPNALAFSVHGHLLTKSCHPHHLPQGLPSGSPPSRRMSLLGPPYTPVFSPVVSQWFISTTRPLKADGPVLLHPQQPAQSNAKQVPREDRRLKEGLQSSTWHLPLTQSISDPGVTPACSPSCRRGASPAAPRGTASFYHWYSRSCWNERYQGPGSVLSQSLSMESRTAIG